MIQLKSYQEYAVENLKSNCDYLLKSSENEICVLESPTGSGKTIICAEFLKKFVKEREDQKKFSFIWISVRRLHEQSKDKLERYYEHDRLFQCSYFEDLQDKMIDENEILFINWHSINKKDINIYVRENEQDNNLNAIIKNTKDDAREIILIIDESHHTASSEKSKELIESINPKITLEVSATPHLKASTSAIVRVSLDSVKEEEMIKSEISVNPEFMKIKVGPKSATELVIEQAIKKRIELKKMYEKEKSNVNPLILIQLPDKKEGLERKKDEVIKILKNKFHITDENNKLAIWLSEEKSESLPNIEKNENQVEVLMFKQAIALGWDCPRASILVIFRESKSVIFTIQVIGRIMRMSEQKYYQNEPELNKGYIFTNLEDIEIAEDYVKDYVTLYEAKRNDKLYKNISIPSIYLRRQRERTRLSGEFSKIFTETALKFKLKNKISSKPSKIVNPVIADGKIKNIDEIGKIDHEGKIDLKLGEVEIQNMFDNFIRNSCTPYAPRDSSDRLKIALYNYLKNNFGIEKLSIDAQKLVLGKENVQSFHAAINLAKEKYQIQIVKKVNEKRELQPTEKWEVPILVSYNSKCKKMDSQKSILKPLYVKKPSEPETKFMEYLDQSNKVKWWFKNGESETKYFAVLYEDEHGIERTFYVDFIVKFTDGTIGLFDTKSGMTAKDAGPRSNGLQKYIDRENKKGKKLWGGIAINVNGTWRYNDDKKYHYDPNNLSKWKILEL